MKRILSTVGLMFIFYFQPNVWSANEFYSAGGRSFALSNASLSLSDPYAGINNQAALAFYNKTSFAASYKNLFFTSNIGIKHALLNVATKFGVVGMAYQQIDFAGYYDAKTGISFARKFSEVFSAGLQFDILIVRPDFAEKVYYNFTGEVSLMAKPTSKLAIGFHIYNPFSVSYQTLYYTENVPVVSRLGMRYAFTEDVFISMEGEGHSIYGFNFKTGFEYQIANTVGVQLGVGSNPVQISFGAGVLVKSFQINMGIIQSEKAGRSAGISIDYAF